MRSHCVRTDTLASCQKFEPVRLQALSQTVIKKVKKGVREQIHARCMNKNFDSLNRLSQHQDKWQKWRNETSLKTVCQDRAEVSSQAA